MAIMVIAAQQDGLHILADIILEIMVLLLEFVLEQPTEQSITHVLVLHIVAGEDVDIPIMV